MKLIPTDLPLTKGAKFKNVTIGALRLGKLIIITIEGEPSSYVETEDIVISGLPGARNGSWPVALATKDQNYAAIVDGGGNLKIWYPGYTVVSRIECTVMYIAE